MFSLGCSVSVIFVTHVMMKDVTPSTPQLSFMDPDKNSVGELPDKKLPISSCEISLPEGEKIKFIVASSFEASTA